MISKDDVLRQFNKEEHDEVIKVYESMTISYMKDIPIFTNFFCTPNIWSFFVKTFNSKSFEVETCESIKGDRRIIAFNNKYNSPYPFKFLKIENNSKFTELVHRDYLGALMSLGIKRDKLGDLRVDGNSAIVPVYEDMVSYLLENLTMVRNCPVKTNCIDTSEVPEVKYQESTINVASIRLDSVVAKIINVSRTNAVELINSNKVLLDYSRLNDKSQDVEVGNIITISGFGKYIVGEILGTTKSGRIRINIKKYI